MSLSINVLGERLKQLSNEEKQLIKHLDKVVKQLGEIDKFVEQKHHEWQLKRETQTASVAEELARLGLKLTTDEKQDLNCWVPKVISDKRQQLIEAKLKFDDKSNLAIAALYAAFQAANRLLLPPADRTKILEKITHLKVLKEGAAFERDWSKNWSTEYQTWLQNLNIAHSIKSGDYSQSLEEKNLIDAQTSAPSGSNAVLTPH